MGQEDMVEISLIDIAAAFRRRWKLFLAVLLVCVLSAGVVGWRKAARVTLAQRVQPASFVSGAALGPLDSVTLLSAVVLPRLIAQQQDAVQSLHLVGGLQASPLVIKNPINMFDKQGNPVKQYVPTQSVFNLTLSLKNNSDVAMVQAKTVFDQLLQSLQAYQAPRIAIRKNAWTQSLSLAQQQLAGVSRLSQQLQRGWDRSDILGKGRLQAKAVSTLTTTSGLSGADIASLMTVDRMSNFGMQYQTKLATLRSSIQSDQLSLKTIEPARLIGTPYFVAPNGKLRLLLLLGCVLGFILACMAVGLAELFKKRD